MIDVFHQKHTAYVENIYGHQTYNKAKIFI